MNLQVKSNKATLTTKKEIITFNEYEITGEMIELTLITKAELKNVTLFNAEALEAIALIEAKKACKKFKRV